MLQCDCPICREQRNRQWNFVDWKGTFTYELPKNVTLPESELNSLKKQAGAYRDTDLELTRTKQALESMTNSRNAWHKKAAECNELKREKNTLVDQSNTIKRLQGLADTRLAWLQAVAKDLEGYDIRIKPTDTYSHGVFKNDIQDLLLKLKSLLALDKFNNNK
jgi:hypothetical protein